MGSYIMAFLVVIAFAAILCVLAFIISVWGLFSKKKISTDKVVNQDLTEDLLLIIKRKEQEE
jgi:hypothetical protein